MKVYRLEQNGWGIWSGGCPGVTWPPDAVYKEFGCTIVKAHYKEEWRFGCESIEKIIEYFGSDFARLLDNGCTLMEYTVHKAHVLFSMEGIEVAFKIDKVKEKRIMLEEVRNGNSVRR